MVQLPSSIVEVVLPEAFINGTIGPPHDSVSLLDIRAILQHLPRVDGTFLRVVVDPHVVDPLQIARLVLRDVVFNDLVPSLKALPCMMSSEVGLDFDNLLLLARGVRK